MAAAGAAELPATMRAWQYSKHGGDAESLTLNEKAPVPKPSRGQVVVRVRAASINPADWKLQSGLLPFLPLRFPATAGLDLSGEVVALGPGATKYAMGDAVFGRAPLFRMGALAQYAVLEQQGSALKPACLSHEAAAALPIAGLTALQAVRDNAGLRLPPPLKAAAAGGSSNCTQSDDSSSKTRVRVLVAGASGGIGHLALQMAKAAGAHVTATVGTRNLAFARRLGADEAIDYTSTAGKHLMPSTSLPHATAAAASATPSAPPPTFLYDTIIDCAPYGLPVAAVDRTLHPRGKWVVVSPALSHVPHAIWRCVALRPRRLGVVSMVNSGADLEVLGQLVEEGRVRVEVEKSVGFEEAREAWRRSMEGHVTGKVVVRVD